jgi:glycine cleavage system H protein
LKFPEDLFYTESHEWLKKTEDGMVIVGITDFAQHQLGDIVYVDFSIENGQDLQKGDPYAEIESVKAVESSFMPISGKILEINEGFVEKYGLINSSPYADGWLIKIIPSKTDEMSSLLNHKQYKQLTAELE